MVHKPFLFILMTITTTTIVTKTTTATPGIAIPSDIPSICFELSEFVERTISVTGEFVMILPMKIIIQKTSALFQENYVRMW